MQASRLMQLLPDASPAVCDILDGARGPLQPPIRSEIFGQQRLAQHGRSLGETHRASAATSRWATFFPRLRENITVLRQAHQYIGVHARTGYDISPAAEWLLDNFHLIEAQLGEIHEGLPRSYFRGLPILVDEPLIGLPRIYGVAWAFVAHTDGAFDEDLLIQFLSAYQETRELTLGETWALPTTLRVVLVENLRRLAERVAAHKAARELANLCCEHLDAYSTEKLDALLALLNQRGVGRMFLSQMAQRLLDRRSMGDTHYSPLYRDWVQAVLPDLGALRTQQAADQAADNLSVSNAVSSLRAIGDSDWPDIVARASTLMRVMLDSPVFEAEDVASRDQTLHSIERLARRGAHSEVAVAQVLLDLMRGGANASDDRTVPGYWLRGAGRPTLWRSLGLRRGPGYCLPTLVRRAAPAVYLGSILIGTLWLTTWLLRQHGAIPALPWLTLIGALLMLFPASETVVALVNRLISESTPPEHMARLALLAGIPPEHRVLVVVPAMLTELESVSGLVNRLRLHYLANPEPQAQFALLSDWGDADGPRAVTDQALLSHATRLIQEINTLHPRASAENVTAPRFLLLHRERTFCETEQRWIGWERKRGKLEQLLAALATGSSSAFLDLGELSRLCQQTRYIVTLDSDTQLPPGRLRELVGVAAHPQNQPRLGPDGRSVLSGYAILQPHVATPLPSPREFTLYHWLFAGHCGMDPYSAASSEVYQDLFGEGTFTGKGLLHVDALHALLTRRLPQDSVLSHDLLEGSLTRCATVTDIALIEDAPFHADVAASRIHRWTRGDWQLLPFLLSPRRYPMRTINRWKMFDNLRRSLVAPMSLALLSLTLTGAVLSPGAALTLVLAAFSLGPLMGAVASFVPRRSHVAWRHFYRQATDDSLRALCTGLWHLAMLVQQALLAVDAIGRTLYRLLISQRHLLQWTTAAVAQAQARNDLGGLARRHWKEPAAALSLLALYATSAAPQLPLALLLCLLWGAAPLWIWWASRAHVRYQDEAAAPQELAYLEGVARDTWRFFERCVVAQENHLPPDNLQLTPHEMVAHRTSPTNIGLYLLSVACARQFGWIGTQDLLLRLERTLASVAGLRRQRGHFMNWYDTQSCEPLLPMYVSTVDSGNLCGHLLALAHACLELTRAPHDLVASRRALQAGQQRLMALLPAWPALAPELPADCALLRLVGLTDPLGECLRNGAQIAALLSQAGDELSKLLASRTEPAVAAAPAPGDELAWCLLDQLATLRSAWLDVQAGTAISTGGVSGTAEATRRLQALATTCQELAWQADFAFLYHPKRHLLHIGYRVAEQQLDAGFYDLLASESRLTSLLAIAKGDLPVRHWACLGRPFFASGAHAGLRSWAGSMFEYLMPGLVLDEPQGSVLRQACHAALQEQIAFARSHEVPWGISESAYAGADHTLAFQYAPQGVPALALRRTPADELVIAPYATALAAQIAPHRACINFVALQDLQARTRYGFVEALDFSAARQMHGEAFTVVGTFMTHHQGMTIVALGNLLLDHPAQRWAMASAPIQAVASLLHERAPREVSMPYLPQMGPLRRTPKQRRASGLLRELVPGASAIEPTHVLSNGRYSVALRANGAGWSRWRQIGITRSRDDALRDAHGSFFYLRRLQPASNEPAAAAVSLTQHPAPDPLARYHCTYHADRVCFEASWIDLQAQSTVWVSPEDDIEFRRIELRNLSDAAIAIELMSVFEVTLADNRADEAHPAFSNLFVRAQWQQTHQALVFQRVPRLDTEAGLLAAHFLTDTDAHLRTLRVQTDRQRWLGRNRAASQPLASFDELPQAASGAAVDLNAGLDPVCALAAELHIPAHAKAVLTFATVASDSASTLHAVIDKYRQSSHVQRASLMSATLTSVRLLSLRISPETFAAIQTLSSALLLGLSRPPAGADRSSPPGNGVCDRRLLWRFGISGDRPLIVVSADTMQALGFLRSLAQALSLWSWAGVACDLLVINAEPVSYLDPLQREIILLRDRHAADNAAQAGPPVTALHLLRADELSDDELSTVRSLARVCLDADERPLSQHVQQWIALHEQAHSQRQAIAAAAVAPAPTLQTRAASVAVGDFTLGGAEFEFDVSAALRPLRPWVNVLSNPSFGALISEAGAGYSWALNSRLNQLTCWSNDPVADPPSEWFLLQDQKSRRSWSALPNAWLAPSALYHVTQGQGYSVITHRSGDLQVTATCCVDAESSVKQVQLALVNKGHSTLQLRLVGMVEWMMGASRSDRSTVQTVFGSELLPNPDTAAVHPGSELALELRALFCTQRERAAGFGGGTAFFGLPGPIDEVQDWSCDRREFFDANGALQLPERLGKSQGGGLDPCAALSTQIVLEAGASAERTFLLGYASTADEARKLAALAAVLPPRQRMAQVRSRWERLLGATQVQTPDPLFDAMVNHWLLYQTVSCRLWARAGFYQAGGATGFRDQLQDAMALTWAAPEMLRQQIALCASRQFAGGDVQHWWHAPRGDGVRTHFSDDLLWLPYACVHYLRATGDAALLDQSVAFLDGADIPEGADDIYETPHVSSADASVYEHAARTIDRSLRVGVHGLPLMGSGDWNDSMNRVGHEGRGESVWLGWFLCSLVADFAPLARARGDAERARRWENAAWSWRLALKGAAWDGHWFKRAFFDSGEALGSQGNREGRIDLIAQAWAVLSGAAPAEQQRHAMAALQQHLVDREAGLIKLIDPPLVQSSPNAGYIQAYPPGVRENGGQYSHAGVWALMAQAELASSAPEGEGSAEDSDTAYRYFTYLSPAHRAQHPVRGPAYGVEPYVMAGDVYSQPPFVGRGGWSWYTGASGWMQRAAIESIFGLKLDAQTLCFKPCLPSHWQRAELKLVRDSRSMRFILVRSTASAALASTAQHGATLLRPGELVNWTGLPAQSCFAIPLLHDSTEGSFPP